MQALLITLVAGMALGSAFAQGPSTAPPGPSQPAQPSAPAQPAQPSAPAQPVPPSAPAPGPSAVAPVAPAGAASNAAANAASAESGKVAYYGRKFAGRRTSSGERFDPNALTMAHRTLPFGTVVKVTNKANGNTVELRVNDRGPAQADRLGDVSLAASKRLDFGKAGIIDATIEVVSAPSEKR